MRRTAEDIVEIGRDLIAVKEKIGHGNFGRWIDTEFDMAERSAQKFMQAAKRWPKSAPDADLSLNVIYELAAPSTPDEVVAKVEAKVPPMRPELRVTGST